MIGRDRMRGPGDNSTDKSHSIKRVASNMYNVCVQLSIELFSFLDKETIGRERMRGPGDNSADKSHSIKPVAF